MGFEADQKEKHVKLAEEALQHKDYKKAYFHTLKAAEFALKLAKKYSDTYPAISKTLVREANGLIDVAEDLKQKVKATPESPKVIDTSDEDKKIPEETQEKEEGGVSSPWLLAEKPNITLKDVAGLKEAKKILMDNVITPFMFPEEYHKYGIEPGTGILLFGPPGTGKTYLGKALAGQLDIPFFRVDISKVVSKWVGDTEKHITRIFEEAQKYGKAIIFFDEIDGLFSKRGSGSTVMDRAIAHFLSTVDGVEKKKYSLLLIGTTNAPWKLDEALLRPGRFSRILYVGLPDKEARKKMFEQRILPFPHDDDIDFDKLAEMSEGYSGADIDYLCRVARLKAVKRTIEQKIRFQADQEESPIKFDDLLAAFEEVKPSITKEQLERYEKWLKEHNARIA